MSLFFRNRRQNSKTRTRWAKLMRIVCAKRYALAFVVTIVALFTFHFSLFTPHASAAAGIFKPINYQGKLSSTGGLAIPNGTYNMRFKIFNAETGGVAAWTETRDNTTKRVTATGGLFSIPLGTHTTMTGSVDFNSDSLYLQVEFDPGNDGVYEEVFTPRRRFASVPYAHNADALDGLDSTQFLRADADSTSTGVLTINIAGGTLNTIGLRILQTMSGAHIHAETSLTSSGTLVWEGTASGNTLRVMADSYFMGKIGIGTSSPETKLEVVGTISGALITQNGAGSNYFMGNVGIGSTTASYSLDVLNNIGLGARFRSAGSSQVFIESAGGGISLLGLGANTDNDIGSISYNTSSNSMAFQTNNSVQMTILSSGNVGIGTTSPGYKLHVEGDIALNDENALILRDTIGKGAYSIHYANDGARYPLRFVGASDTSTHRYFEFGHYSSDLNPGTWNPQVVINSYTGNVGIGTTAPKAKLDVVGTISGSRLSISNNANISGALLVRGVMSGTNLTLSNSASISGTLIVKTGITSKGSVSGATIDGFGLGSCAGTYQKLLYNAATDKFECGTIATSSTFGTGNVLTIGDARYLKRSGGTMTGALVINLTTGHLGLRIIQTASGNIIHAEKTLTSSGMIMVTQRTLQGSGALVADQRINSTGAYLTSRATSAPLLVLNTSLADSSAAPHILFGYNGTFDVSLWRSTTSTLKTNGSFHAVGVLSGTNLTVSRSASISGTLIVKTGITSKGSVSGATIDGFGLGSCNGGSSKLLYNSTTDTFECGTISASSSSFGTGNVLTIGDARYLKRSGGTMTGQLVVDITSGNLNTVGLKVINTLSGAHLHAERTLTSSGNLLVEGLIETNNILIPSSGPIQFKQSTTGIVIWNWGDWFGASSTTARFALNAQGPALYNANNVDVLHTNNSAQIIIGGTSLVDQVAALTVTPRSAVEKAIVAKGIAGQSANLQEWQNSAGTALALITAGGTLSGQNLTIGNSASISGTLIVKTGITSKGSLSGSTFYGAGLGSCTGSSEKLLYNNSTGKFECGTISTASTFGTGNVLTIGDARYLRTAGGTMTGILIVKQTISGSRLTISENANISGALLVKGNVGIGTTSPTSLLHLKKADATAAGGIQIEYPAGNTLQIYNDSVNANYDIGGIHRFRVGGSIKFIVGGTDTTAVTNILPNTTNGYTLGSDSLRWSNIYGVNGLYSGLVGIGTTSPRAKLEVAGSISGATLFVQSMSGAGLTDCDAASSKLIWDATTEKFSCGTVSASTTFGTGNVLTIGDARYLKRSGGTMTGALVINLTTGHLGLRIIQTASGNIIHAEKTLTSSGMIMVTQRTLQGSGALVADQRINSTGAYLTSRATSAPLLVLNTSLADSSAAPHILFGYNGTFDVSIWRSTTSTLKTNGSFHAVGVLSGSNLTVSRSASISGTLIVKTGITSKGSVSGATIDGFGLGSCAGTYQKLLYNAATDKFECGTIATSSTFGTGNVLTIGDARYLKRSGGTMTGQLVVDITNGNLNTVGLKVINTLSGAHLHAESLLTSSGALRVEGTGDSYIMGNVGIGTTSPIGKLQVIDGSSANITYPLFVQNNNVSAGNGLGTGIKFVSYTDASVDTGRIENVRDSSGIYSLRFSTYTSPAVAEIMRITNGNVGIGTTSPKAKLDVVGTISGSRLSISNNANISGALLVRGVMSGTNLTLSNSASISGTLIVKTGITSKGSVSGATIDGFGLGSCNGGSSKLLYNSSTDKFECGTISAGSSSFGTGNVLTIGDDRYLKRSGGTMTGQLVVDITNGNFNTVGLKVINTLSGAHLHAERTLTSSGNLTVKGDITTQTGSLWQPVYRTDDGLVGYWSFSETGSTVAYDRSPYGNDGTLNGPTWSSGKYGTALSFDGTNDYVSVATATSVTPTTAISVFAWVKTSGTNDYSGVVDKYVGSAGYQLSIDLGGDVRLDLCTSQGCGAISGTSNVVDGTWKHIGFTYDGVTKRVFVNGVLENSTAATGTITDSGQALLIGNDNEAASRFFNGLIDDVRIYSRALTDDEIRTQYLGVNADNAVIANKFRILNTSNAVLLNMSDADRTLEFVGTLSGSRLSVSGNANITGALLTVGNITTRGTLSGSNLTVSRSASISGTLLVKSSITSKGSVSGATLFGFGLGDCSNETTSKLIYNNSTGKFACASDQNGGAGGLTFSTAEGIYVNQSGDTMTGVLTINVTNGNLNTVGLKVINTLSGAHLHAEKALTSSGMLILKKYAGTGTGNILIVDTQGLVYDATNKRVGIGTTSPDAPLHVNRDDTLTTVLRLENNDDSADQYVGQVSFAGLDNLGQRTDYSRVIGGIGNATDGVERGQVVFETLVNGGSTVTMMLDGNVLEVFGTLSGSNLTVSRSASISGTLLVKTGITSKGSVSGATLFGFGLGDCSNETTSKLIYNNSTGKFACASDQTGGAGGLSFSTAEGIYVNQGGDTMTGALTINVTNGNVNTVGLKVINTLSGAHLHAERTMSSSGEIILKKRSGSSTGNILIVDTAGLVYDASNKRVGIGTANPAGPLHVYSASATPYMGYFQNANGTLWIYNDSSGVGILTNTSDGWLTHSATNAGSFLQDGSIKIAIDTNGRLGVGTSAPKAQLDVIGTISGSRLVISGNGAFSGSLVVKNTLSGSSLFGFGLGDCSNETTSKLIYNNSTGKFACASDQTGGAGGLTFSTAEGIYVNQSGDTMTGALTINVTNGNLNTVGLKVINTLSGAHLHAESLLTSSGALRVEGTGDSYIMGNVGIGTTSPGAQLQVNAGASTTIGAIVKGAASQSANLTEWQNSAGTVLARVTSAGGFEAGASDFFGALSSTSSITAGSFIDASSIRVDGSQVFDTSGARLDIGSAGGFTTATLVSGNSALVQIGGTTSSFPALKVVNSNLQIIRADGSTNADLYVSGNVGIGTTAPKAQLDVVGTVSGSRLTISNNANISGALLTVGNITTRGTLSGTNLTVSRSASISGTLIVKTGITSKGSVSGATIDGFGLGSCNGGSSKLLYNSTTDQFECGTISASSSSFGTGNVLTIGDARYVKKSGDTMTGTLVLSPQSGLALNARGTISGSQVHAGQILTSSGLLMVTQKQIRGSGALVVDQRTNSTGAYMTSLATKAPLLVLNTFTNNSTYAPHILFGYQGTFDLSMRRSTASTLAISGSVVIDRTLTVQVYGAATATTVCRTGTGMLAACSSSLRYKEDVQDLSMGLSTIRAMNPVNFKWKDRNERDFGFIAEEMEQINPLLVEYDTQGRVQGVKYMQLTAVLTNAVKTLDARTLGITNDSGTVLHARDLLSTSGSLLITSITTDGTADLIRLTSNVSSTGNTVFRVNASGAVFSDSTFNSQGADYAEWFKESEKGKVNSEKLQPGEVVCIDILASNTVTRCERGADPNVMGIVSTNPAFIGNSIRGADGMKDTSGYVLVGLIGQVPAKVTLDGGPIRAGDSLTAAAIGGFARRALAGESTVGVALESYDGTSSVQYDAGGRSFGIVNVLISRRNQSLTVETVEEKVLASIASMNISDEVSRLVQSASSALDVDERVTEAIEMQMSAMNIIEQVNATIDRRLSGAALTVESTLSTAQIEQVTQLIVGHQTLSGSLRTALTDLETRIDALESLSGSIVRFGSGRTLHSAAATVDRTLTVNGTLHLSGSLVLSRNATIGSMSFSGSEVQIGSLVSSGSLRILGNITIEGLARFLGDVHIRGQLVLSGKQAGFASIPKSGSSVTVTFNEPMIAVPVVTATPDTPTLFAVSKVTATGFTIRISPLAPEKITFSYIALAVEDPKNTHGTGSEIINAPTPFPVNALGQPVSSDTVWNSCINGRPLITSTGEPISCARYHDGYIWEHPDLRISFTYKPNSEPPVLLIPEGYIITLIDDDQAHATPPVKPPAPEPEPKPAPQPEVVELEQNPESIPPPEAAPPEPAPEPKPALVEPEPNPESIPPETTASQTPKPSTSTPTNPDSTTPTTTPTTPTPENTTPETKPSVAPVTESADPAPAPTVSE